MTTIELRGQNDRLREMVRELVHGPVVVTENGQPVAVLVSPDAIDVEDEALAANPAFLAMLEASRESRRSGGGISIEELERDEEAGAAGDRSGQE